MTKELTERLMQALNDEKSPSIGDVVYAKCGGPPMLIDRISEEHANCVWFDKHTCQERKFPIAGICKNPPRKDGKALGLLIIGELTPQIVDGHIKMLSDDDDEDSQEN